MLSFAKAAVAAGIVATLLGAPAQARDVVVRQDGKTVVNAPTTKVEADERTGDTRVKVRAPDTAVDVDTERREVRIRVPFFSGDIRW